MNSLGTCFLRSRCGISGKGARVSKLHTCGHCLSRTCGIVTEHRKQTQRNKLPKCVPLWPCSRGRPSLDSMVTEGLRANRSFSKEAKESSAVHAEGCPLIQLFNVIFRVKHLLIHAKLCSSQSCSPVVLFCGYWHTHIAYQRNCYQVWNTRNPT